MEYDIEEVDGNTYYYKKGSAALHREDGPAVIRADGTVFWYKDDEIHREDGPAFISHTGYTSWYKNNKLHREDGPAVVGSGHKAWYRNGVLHREDGPAEVYDDGTEIWYLDGVQMTEEEFYARVN